MSKLEFTEEMFHSSFVEDVHTISAWEAAKRAQAMFDKWLFDTAMSQVAGIYDVEIKPKKCDHKTALDHLTDDFFECHKCNKKIKALWIDA